MSKNPLQQYFRQPKIFISLPSHGVYNIPGAIQGDVENLPVFGMTGMDEILLKTPDSLLTGESTIKVIESCCPSIKDANEVSLIDLNTLLIAIRIATYGNKLMVSNTCTACNTEHDYEIELSSFIEYYKANQFNNKLVLNELTLTLRPLTYKESLEISLRNFEIQQQMKQLDSIENEIDKRSFMMGLFEKIGNIQQDLYVKCIETVKIGQQSVTEKPFIEEWIKNCDKETTDQLKDYFQQVQVLWNSPSQDVKCDACGAVNQITVEFDQSNFFATA